MNGYQKLGMVLADLGRNAGGAGGVRIDRATVTSPPPDLTIQIDGLDTPFTKEFLSVGESVLYKDDGTPNLNASDRVMVISSGAIYFIIDKEVRF